MAKTHTERMAELSCEDQQEVLAMADNIRAEISLRELRKALGLSQKDMATLRNVSQASISKEERRKDMQISTLCKIIEAMGGSVEITAHLPDRGPVLLKGMQP